MLISAYVKPFLIANLSATLFLLLRFPYGLPEITPLPLASARLVAISETDPVVRFRDWAKVWQKG
jgi:hypothetical protein